MTLAAAPALVRVDWATERPCADVWGRLCFAELGIDLQGILKRSLAILSYRLGSPTLLDLDMGGPLLFAAILGSVHLLVRAFQAWPAWRLGTILASTTMPKGVDITC